MTLLSLPSPELSIPRDTRQGSHPASLPRGYMALLPCSKPSRTCCVRLWVSQELCSMGCPWLIPSTQNPQGRSQGCQAQPCPGVTFPTELSDRVICPLTAPLATRLRGRSPTPQMVPSPRGSRVLAHKPTPGLSLQGQVRVPQPLSQAAAPEEWELLGTAASRGSWTTPGTGRQTHPAMLAGQQRVADGQSCPTAAWAGDAQKAPLVPPCFS